jgi:Mg-chelatase subunit ChlD
MASSDAAPIVENVEHVSKMLEDWVLEDGTCAPALAEKSKEDQSASAVSHPSLQVEVALEYPVVTTDSCQLQAVLSVLAPPTAAVRPPLRLVAILDRSGSMQGAKLELVRNTMLYMLGHLSERDALALVTYETKVQELSPLIFCNSSGREFLKARLRAIQSGAQTNLSGGMIAGIDAHRKGVQTVEEGGAAPMATCAGFTLQTVQEEGVVRSAFLFTDGLANVGITKAEDLCAAARGALEDLGDRRCTLSTFGFGKDHSGELLKSLAEVGHGSYSYIENEDQMGQAFGEALGGLLTTTHQNVKLSLELARDVSVKETFTKYNVEKPGADSQGDKILTIELGDLFAEERRDILLTLALPSASDSFLCGHLRARGFSVEAKKYEETANAGQGLELCVQRDPSPDEQECHPQVMRHRNRHLMTNALKQARGFAYQGDLVSATMAIDSATMNISASPLTATGDMACTGLIADLQECRGALGSIDMFQYHGAQLMSSCESAHLSQRSCNATMGSEMYMNAGAEAIRGLFQANLSSGNSGYR